MIGQINRLAEKRVPFLLIVDFELGKPMLFPLSNLPDYIRFSTPSFTFPNLNENQALKKNQPAGFEFRSEPVSYSKYKTAFNLVRKNARAGNTYLTNLTFPSKIRTNLSLAEIYSLSRARYKLLYRNDFVVFSPEIFIQIRNGQIRSFPMKGTIDASIPGAEEILLGDEKEMAEHVTIVDLIRNDLSIHADRVRVEKFRYLETLNTSNKNLLQVSSAIVGELKGNWHASLGDIIFSMLPAGSVSGAPKPETLRIIKEAEGSDRGYYTGIMGYYDGNEFDSSVLIRYIENKNGEYFYHSGGGITFLSDPEKEYQELIDKVYVPVT